MGSSGPKCGWIPIIPSGRKPASRRIAHSRGPIMGIPALANASTIQAIGSNQVGGHERHVAHPTAPIQQPHAEQNTRLSEDHTRSQAKRPALDLKARQLVFTAAKLVVRVAITHRVPLDAATSIPQLTLELARPQA